MITINFYLDRQAKNHKRLILCYVRGLGGPTIVVSTQEKVLPANWNKDKQRVKASVEGALEINERLTNIKKTIIKIYRNFLADSSEFAIEDFKAAIKQALHQKPPLVIGFFAAWDLYIQTKTPTLATNTLKKYGTIRNYLREFDKNLTFSKLDLLFFDRFQRFLVETKHLTNNSVCKVFSFLKAFLNWATERSLNKNLSYKKFQTKWIESDIIYLTEDELMKIYNTDFGPILNKARDIFCFACFTGARFSDVAHLEWQDIHNNIWYLRTMKTKEIIEIPLTPWALSILDRYQYQSNPLPRISNQKLNEYLKQIGKLAGIDEPVTISRYIGGQRVEETKPKYEFLTMHTARRTFITLSLEKGVRPEVLIEITGHSSLKMLRRYIKITSKVKEVELVKAWQLKSIFMEN